MHSRPHTVLTPRVRAEIAPRSRRDRAEIAPRSRGRARRESEAGTLEIASSDAVKGLLLGAREEGTVDTAHVALAREGGAKRAGAGA